MNLNCFLVLIMLLFLNVSAWANEPVASITFSDPIVENNISLVVKTAPSAEAYTEITVKDGQTCLYIPENKYAYFKVDDSVIFEDENELIFKITYFDEGHGSLALQYNSIGSELSDKYKSQSFKKSASNIWATVTMALTDASFRNLQNNNSDFRLTEVNYIKSIEIYLGTLNPEEENVPITTGSHYSEFKGKSVAGYQAWFTASDENNNWVHWSNNSRPEPGNSSFEVYPDVREYSRNTMSVTGFANLGNGEPSQLFTSTEVIDKHFEWMKTYGIEGVALQRFIGDTPYPINHSAQSKLMKVKNAAEKSNRIFYICYDMSSGRDENAWVESIKFDWVYNIEQTNNLTSSPAYATVNNKPVVQIWGPGFTSRVGNASGTIELIEFLKSRGCYVIGGVPTHWRKEVGDSKPGFLAAYKTYDMVSPWTPGRYKNLTEVDNFKRNQLEPDKQFCDENDLDYLPVIFPGFAWSTWNNGTPNHIPRQAGQFLWRQALNIKATGLDQMYFAMFDEYDEGTAIMKAATDWSMIPTDFYFLTLSADGIWVSSDFYLRVAGEATKMLHSSDNSNTTLSVPHSEGPVYYRNSFEKRFTTWERNGIKDQGYENIDPCFYKASESGRNNVLSPKCEISLNEHESNSGLFALEFSGSPNSLLNATYEYKFSEVQIPVVDGLKLSFWKKSKNELGQFVSIDLLFKSGKKLSQLTGYTDNNGAAMNPTVARGNAGGDFEQFICEIGKGELLGDEITAITIAYSKPAESGSFSAFIDDVLIATNIPQFPTNVSGFNKNNHQIRIKQNKLYFTDFQLGSKVKIYDISGRVMKTFTLNANSITIDYPNGIYIITVTAKEKFYSQKVIFSK